MKLLDKIGLAIFSIIVLILSILVCLITLGYIDSSIISVGLTNAILMQNGIYIIVGICVVLILLSIKCLFFPSWDKNKKVSDDSEGIMLQNESGKLLITKETIKNLVSGVVSTFDDIEGAESEVEIDELNDVYVNLSINVLKGVVIKDVSTKLQNDIKEKVKSATDLEIKAINIKVNYMDEDKQKDEENIKDSDED